MMKNLRRNWLVVSKLTWGIWRILTRAHKSLKSFHFNEFLLTKAYTFELKKYRGVIFHDTEEWWKKIWKKPDLWFGKWHEKFGKFPLEHPKVIKLRPRWDLFIQSRKCLSWKFTEEFWIMTRKNNAEFEKELTYRFKIDMRNLTNFDPSTHKFQKFALYWAALDQSI